MTGTLDRPNDLDAYWMPFTANRRFKADPVMVVAAEGMHYRAADGRAVLDGSAGLWCVNAGHGRKEIADAVARSMATLDYAPSFQVGHPVAFTAASRLADLAPADLKHVFFTNSGSESVDTALKLALAYHRARGEGQRTRLIGRERGYHGVGFGGISVGGIPANRKAFGALLPGVDHLPHTHLPGLNAFSRGQPAHGAELADALERIVALHDPSTIAAVIVEPVACSTGVLIPPKGYLERLRAICDKYGILLIFDEVITGFGRLGSPFAATRFGITPDLITCAKGLTNGAIPMGAVLVREAIHAALMTGPEDTIEFFHGYTYSGHPTAAAAAIATLDIYAREGLFEHAASLEKTWEDAVHGLRGLPHVIDIRNLGLLAGIEMASVPGKPGVRGYAAFRKCFERGVLLRFTGDILALSPPLIISRAEIERIFATLAEVLRSI
jgi:beta-alanine--pyruvate transaminase